MAAFEVIALDTATPQLRAPGASDTYTFPRAVEMPLGTANSVLFLNGSKVVSSGSALTFDGTNLATTALTQVGYVYNTTSANTEARNWATTSNDQVFGDFAIRQSTAFGGNPLFAGRILYYINPTGDSIWSPGGSEQMRLTSTGLGIGTTSPGANLQIGAATSGSQVVALAYSAASAGTIDFRANGSAFGAAWIQHDAASGAMRFATAGNERMRLKSTGQLRYIPLAADPTGAENGDVYYNSGTNKLRLYAAGAWVDLN